MASFSERLHKVIPGGAHTYSRGDDQFPSNAPEILKSGTGAYVLDAEGNKYLDYGMALRAVSVGYNERKISDAAISEIYNGNNLTRASIVELEAAELLVDLIDSADMVKFAKNGSTAVSAAVKLARAYTGKNIIGRCAQHPFFSYDDWFIGSTVMNKGVTNDSIQQTKLFNYNDIESVKKLFEDNEGEVACIVMEPATIDEPEDNFLHKVKDLCKENGAVFILDEMITGFRWHLKGAQEYYNIQADLCTFGKSMANGFSVAAVAGKKEIMELGGIQREGSERVFLLSTTHGAEMSSLAAFIETVAYLKENNVVEHLWDYGKKFKTMVKKLTDELEISDYFKIVGPDCSPNYMTIAKDGKPCLAMRTIFSQEMIRNKVLMPWISFSFAHKDEELEITKNAMKASLAVYKKALNGNVHEFLEGHIIKPVFRKYN